MDNLRIPDLYPVIFAKTVTLKVDNIVKHNDTQVGYSFTVTDDDGLIINFDQFISTNLCYFLKIILYASVDLHRSRRIVDQDPLITGCVGLMPPGNKALEYFIIEAYDELMAHMGKPSKRVNVKVEWPGKEEEDA